MDILHHAIASLMCTTHPDVINPDLLAFIRGDEVLPAEEKILVTLAPA